MRISNSFEIARANEVNELSIVYGPATVLWCPIRKCWPLPGKDSTRDEATARKWARKMEKLMGGI